ncbi:MAG: hypothetical protein PHN60_00215 [Candidatus Gracilibacteria bacterium]|nr:hypothetical protein [Candidatus Gracilibacteria bacterium]
MLYPSTEIENPSLYTKTELYFFDVMRILKEDGVCIEKYFHKKNKFIDTVIDLSRERFPIHANLFLTAHNSLSAHDKTMFFYACIHPFLSEIASRQKENFCNRVQQLLACHG